MLNESISPYLLICGVDNSEGWDFNMGAMWQNQPNIPTPRQHSLDVSLDSLLPITNQCLYPTGTIDSPNENITKTAESCRKGKVRNNGRPNNPLPRHKRTPHLHAELRRRNKIQKALDELDILLSSVSERPAMQESKSSKLFKVAERCRRLRGENEEREKELTTLRTEIRDLTQELQKTQSLLPVVGMTTVHKPPCHLYKLLDSYIITGIHANAKFRIFSWLLRPLFASYNTSVDTTTPELFLRSVLHWAKKHLTFSSLHQKLEKALHQLNTRNLLWNESNRISQDIFPATGASK